MNSLIGQKKTQSQRFLEDGTRIPVTSIAVLGNTVVFVKTKDRDGYSAIQLGRGIRKNASKAVLGHSKGARLTSAPLSLKEVRIYDDGAVLPNVGDIIKASDVFKAGDVIDVIGMSKGKGYAGGVKRHHFKGGPRTHGQSDRERAPGSIGQTTTPGRVYKGKRMAGRMGHERVTIQNLKVVDVTDEYLLIKGLVPGPLNSFVIIKKTGEDKKFVPLYKEETKEVLAEGLEQKAENEPQVQNETEGQVKETQAAGAGQPQQSVQISTDDQTKKIEVKEEGKEDAS